MPDDPLLPPLLELVRTALGTDRSADRLGYPIQRRLRTIRDQLAGVGWPRTFDERLGLTLIPLIAHAARTAGVDWTRPGPVAGVHGPLFEIDARVMNRGRGRRELEPGEFTAYLAESGRLCDEWREARARMHNGETAEGTA